VGRKGWEVRWEGAGEVRRREEDGFLCLSAAMGPVGSKRWWELVCVNPLLGGLVKFGLDFSGELFLQAELPLGEEALLEPRVKAVREGFSLGAAAVWNGASTLAGTSLAGEAMEEGVDLVRLIEETGWPHSVRKGGGFSVPLETQRGSWLARVEEREGRVHATREVGTVDELPPISRLAVAGFLLAASRRLRLARPAVDEDKDGVVARLEVVFGMAPSGLELASAFEALSVGADLCASQIETLGHETVARNFLSSFAEATEDGSSSAEATEDGFPSAETTEDGFSLGQGSEAVGSAKGPVLRSFSEGGKKHENQKERNMT